MDTRSKILAAEAARALLSGGKKVALVTGHFDVVLAGHLRELHQVRAAQPDAILLVALTPPEQPVLDARARAEVVAAFEMVDYVVSLDGPEIAEFLAAVPADRVSRFEPAHQRRLRELIEHVHRRQSR